ncbi:MAG: hypothetical protein KKC05_01090, partial [Nanoarchaeota archaeon]|nr:hypothetical protein [Nanoarchaeota archaeon]
VVVFLEGKGALNGTKVYGIFLSQSEFDWEYGSGLDKHFDVTDTHFLNPNDQQARKIIHSHSTKELPHNWRKRYQL